ncbi:MAG: hypothetical protein AVDCRST_MAG89-4270 [uncultured Gemmatimonadetes bacterium]|uniref:Uncharacterized protein n=1 Tax=uncultured Gemmatimonadota bacterium TaxID=203437 RepID=A0A6J4MSW9_9BACT|nr:MAG: hypothetical protein AVDCRST_MAG89-4270 [uncultured Gemmatimonadota bacterium]
MRAGGWIRVSVRRRGASWIRRPRSRHPRANRMPFAAGAGPGGRTVRPAVSLVPTPVRGDIGRSSR